MESLLKLWSLVASKYGAYVAGIVILIVLGVAYYLGVTPSAVIGWIGK